MKSAIEAHHLSRAYGETRALDRLTVRVPAGSIFGLVGSNGAGKTTTLRILATLLTPSAGWACVAGYDVETQAPEVRRRIGYLPDPPGGYDELKAEEFLLYFARLHRVKTPKRAVADVLALTGLEEVRRRAVSGLSRGTQQRLGLARCLLHRPEVMILDEPASALDPQGRRELLALLREIRDMGATVILSSHILPDLEALCDEVCILDAGRRIAGGTLAALRAELAAEPRWELSVGGDPERAESAVRAHPGASRLVREGATITFGLTGGDGSRAALTARLLEAGVPVAGLRELPPSLERVFLAATSRRKENA